MIELLSMQGLRERISQVAEIEIGGLDPGGDKEPQNLQATAVQGVEQSVRGDERAKRYAVFGGEVNEFFDAGGLARASGAFEQKTEIWDGDADGIVGAHLVSESDLGVFGVRQKGLKAGDISGGACLKEFVHHCPADVFRTIFRTLSNNSDRCPDLSRAVYDVLAVPRRCLHGMHTLDVRTVQLPGAELSVVWS